MEAIKHSRIIIVLLILYIGISILVVTLDKIQTKKGGSSSSETTEKKKDDNVALFISDVENVTNSVVNYVSSYSLKVDSCFKLSQVLGEEYTGSAYVTSDLSSIRLWYKNEELNLAVNNVETKSTTISEDNIESDYSTEYYNFCGFSE